MSGVAQACLDFDWEEYLIYANGSIEIGVNTHEEGATVDEEWARAEMVYHKLLEMGLIGPPKIVDPPSGNPYFTYSTGSIILSVRTNVKATTVKKDWEKAEAIYHYLKERGLIGPIELPHK